MDLRDELPMDLARETAALRRIARGILLEPSLAEDAVQEAWLAALRTQGAPPSGGWLNEAVRRIASGMRRGEARRARREHAGARPEAQPSAADTAGHVELLRGLLDALQALDEPYKSAVQMRLVDDLPPRAIADRLGVPVETARTRVKRGIEQLRALLDAQNAHRRGEFLALLAPLAGFGHVGSTVGTLGGAKTIGGWLVGTKAKLVVVAAVVVALGAWWMQPWESAPARSVPITGGDAPLAAAELARSTEPEVSLSTDSAVQNVGRADERRASADAPAWRLRVRALLADEQPFAGADVRVRIQAGYEERGEHVFDALVTSGADGWLEVVLPPPASALQVEVRGKTPGYLSFANGALVTRGAPPPVNLAVRFYPLDVRVRGVVLDAEGRPIEHALVDGRGEPRSTDATGRFEVLASSALMDERLTVSARGFAEERVVVQTKDRSSVDGLEVHLVPGRALHGRVVDEDGRAVAGATVGSWSVQSADVKTDANGRFVLDGIPPKETWLTVTVDADGFALLRRDFEHGAVPEGEVEFVLERGLDVPGRVVDEHGAPLAGASVYAGEFANGSGVVRAYSDDDGRFVLRRVVRAERRFGVALDGWAPFQGTYEPPARGPFTGEIAAVLGHGRVVRGLVVDADGAPLSGVSIHARRADEYLDGVRTRTDAAGNFELAGLPVGALDTDLELFAKGRVRRNVPLDPASPSALRIVLERSAGISGRVVDAVTGAPVTAFRVRIVPPVAEPNEPRLGGYESSWSEPGREMRDELGRWAMDDQEVAAGQVTGLEITSPGYGPTIVARAVTSVEHAKQPLIVAMTRGASVTGVVVDAASGRPVANVLVRRCTPRDPLGPWEAYTAKYALDTRTDERGAFAFAALPVETMQLYVEAAGFAPVVDGPFDVAPAPARRIELHAGAKLVGRLLDSRGKPMASEPVRVATVFQPPAHGRDWELVTDREGRFELGDLPLATYEASRELRWERGATFDLSQQIEIVEAREYSIELRPAGTGRIVGTLLGATDADATYTVSANLDAGSSAGEHVWRSAIVRDGKFVIDGVQAGRWEVLVVQTGLSTPSRSSGAVDVVVAVDAEVAVEVPVSGS